MHRIHLRWLLPAAAGLTLSATQAQTAPLRSAPPDPLDAATKVPAAIYQSTLSSYRRLGDDQPLAWREANETVGRIGGWRAYAREAAAPATREASTPPGQHEKHEAPR